MTARSWHDGRKAGASSSLLFIPRTVRACGTISRDRLMDPGAEAQRAVLPFVPLASSQLRLPYSAPSVFRLLLLCLEYRVLASEQRAYRETRVLGWPAEGHFLSALQFVPRRRCYHSSLLLIFSLPYTSAPFLSFLYSRS